MMRAVAGAVIGFIYGFVLLFLSVMAGGGGHGIMIPLLMSSAPIAVFEFNSWLAVPVMWAVLGVLIALSGSPNGRALAQAALFLNYVSGLGLVAIFGIPHLLGGLPSRGYDTLVVWVVVYLIGQVIAWRYIRSRQAQP